MRFFLFWALVAIAGCAQKHVASSTASPGSDDLRHGRQLFAVKCAACHGADGRGAGIGPTLHNERNRKTFGQTAAWIKDPEPPMPKLFPAELTSRDVDDLAAYVQSL